MLLFLSFAWHIIPCFLPSWPLKINRGPTTCPPAGGIAFTATGDNFWGPVGSLIPGNRNRAPSVRPDSLISHGDLLLTPPPGSHLYLYQFLQSQRKNIWVLITYCPLPPVLSWKSALARIYRSTKRSRLVLQHLSALNFHLKLSLCQQWSPRILQDHLVICDLQSKSASQSPLTA